MSTKFSFCGYRCCCFLTEKRKQIPGSFVPSPDIPCPWDPGRVFEFHFKEDHPLIQRDFQGSLDQALDHLGISGANGTHSQHLGDEQMVTKSATSCCHMIHMSNPIIQHVVCTTLQLKNLAEKVTFWRDMIAKLLNGYCQKGASCWCKFGCKLCI